MIVVGCFAATVYIGTNNRSMDCFAKRKYNKHLTKINKPVILLLVTMWSLIICEDGDHMVIVQGGDNMPTDLFYQLNNDKKMKIINVGISEFAKHGYINSSTNRIVKNSGISKGSLFKYFQSKEELYFYILDCITAELTASLGEKTESLPKDLFKRVIKYSELEFAWYNQNPDKCKLITKAFIKSDTEIYQKIESRYNLAGQDIYYKLLEDIDTKQFKWDKQKTIDVLKWFLKGFNEDFMSTTEVQSSIEIANIKNEYVKSLTEYMKILKVGITK